MRIHIAAAVMMMALPVIGSGVAHAQHSRIGIIVMHGKGGSPQRIIKPLADGLQDRGYQVANLEMPWSGRRTSVH